MKLFSEFTEVTPESTVDSTKRLVSRDKMCCSAKDFGRQVDDDCGAGEAETPAPPTGPGVRDRRRRGWGASSERSWGSTGPTTEGISANK